MEDNRLYRYVISQLDAGIPKSEIVKKLTSFARLTLEEAENYVNNIELSSQDITNSDESNKHVKKESEDKIKSPVQELFEIAISAVILAIAFGIFLSGGSDSFSNLPNLIEMSLISLLAVSLGFIFHELGHRFVAKKYGYIATYSLWIPGLLLAIITSLFSWIFAAPGAVWIRSKEKINIDEEKYINHLGKISITGPLVNVCLALIFLLLSYLYIYANRFGAGIPTLSLILVVGARINGILAAFNLIPFGPFDGRKVYKWNKVIWFGATILAAGLFIFIQSPISSVENINKPKEPVSYKLYTDLDGRYSFNYPANWRQVTADAESEWVILFQDDDDMVVFCEKHDYAFIAIQSIDLSENNPDIVIDDEMLLDITNDHLEETINLTLIGKNEIVVDPLAEKGRRVAYELRFEDNDGEGILLIKTLAYSDAYLYQLFFVCPLDYYDRLIPAYNQFIESVRFR
ncbi:M50 family metallopeptidase [Chloroflexota bacterium]